ncbi:MAG: NrdJb [Spirochaetia bacterium]
MHEALERPYELYGTTYKVKTPVSDHAMYITINDIILNEGTESEQRRPFEIFINSKNLDHFQWIVALTRIISAVFRKGGDVAFLVEELKAVFDPRGGYWKTGGRYMPSLIAEIGEVIERHLVSIGLMKSESMSEGQRAMLEQKRAEYEQRTSGNTSGNASSGDTKENAHGAAAESDAAGGNNAAGAEANTGAFPAGATLCSKCNTAAVVMLDGCRTCLNCGDSKCN